MKKVLIGVFVGGSMGILDVLPMIAQQLTWDANLSAFSMWVVVGILLSIIDVKIKSGWKGIMISFLVLLPTAILIGWKEPQSLLPISIMTVILGSLSGIIIDSLNKKIQSIKL